MKPVNEAYNTVLENTHTLKPKKAELKEASGRVVSENIFSPTDLPPFNQSAMDGYAVGPWHDSSDNGGHLKFSIKGEIKAGDNPDFHKLEASEAIRIFTGTAIPKGTYTVVKQEDVKEENGFAHIPLSTVKESYHIRKAGSHLKKGEKLVNEGTKVTPASLGLLASTGIAEVKVTPAPLISIMVTGNELTFPGNPLQSGAIYESNGTMLRAAIEETPGRLYKEEYTGDSESETKEKLKKLLDFPPNVILITGGVSVGKYDLVRSGLDQLGVDIIFEKVAQKPGKPLVFGQKNNTLIFGLPGNPAAVLSCFYQYVYPAIRKMAGHANHDLPQLQFPLGEAITKKEGRATFMRIKIENGEVFPLKGQGSDNLMAFSKAHGLLKVPSDVTYREKGAEVTVSILPGNLESLIPNEERAYEVT